LLKILDSMMDGHIRLEQDIMDEDSIVDVDMTQMQMVFKAILQNAQEAIEQRGLIRITVQKKILSENDLNLHPEIKQENYVLFSIRDNGRGMDNKILKRIFDPFFSTKFQGRGLGLAAAFGIIKNHDGWISIASKPDQGTIVDIYLPDCKE
jgi:signal transduction histidine kinase